jgi:hypothetical protein
MTSSPSVTMTIDRIGAFSTGRISTRSMTTPPTNAIPRVEMNATQYGRPALISDQQMYVANIASSPCAKFTTSVA